MPIDVKLVAEGKYVKDEHGRIICVPTHANGAIRPEEWAELFAAAPDMLEMLRQIEWSGKTGWEGEYPCCPACGGLNPAYEAWEKGASPEEEQWIEREHVDRKWPKAWFNSCRAHIDHHPGCKLYPLIK